MTIRLIFGSHSGDSGGLKYISCRIWTTFESHCDSAGYRDEEDDGRRLHGVKNYATDVWKIADTKVSKQMNGILKTGMEVASSETSNGGLTVHESKNNYSLFW